MAKMGASNIYAYKSPFSMKICMKLQNLGTLTGLGNVAGEGFRQIRRPRQVGISSKAGGLAAFDGFSTQPHPHCTGAAGLGIG